MHIHYDIHCCCKKLQYNIDIIKRVYRYAIGHTCHDVSSTYYTSTCIVHRTMVTTLNNTPQARLYSSTYILNLNDE